MTTRAAALSTALEQLADTSDLLTIAVERHDLPGLVDASDRAEALTEHVAGLVSVLSDLDRVELDAPRITGLRARLAESARRNAYLIERAWALDAATMRLLAGLAIPTPDAGTDRPPIDAYHPGESVALHLDREA